MDGQGNAEERRRDLEDLHDTIDTRPVIEQFDAPQMFLAEQMATAFASVRKQTARSSWRISVSMLGQ